MTFLSHAVALIGQLRMSASGGGSSATASSLASRSSQLQSQQLSPSGGETPSSLGSSKKSPARGTEDEPGDELEELFAGIDWVNVNLGELEQKWHSELAAIEEVLAPSLRLPSGRSLNVCACVSGKCASSD